MYPVNLRNNAYHLFLPVSGVSSIFSPLLVALPQYEGSYLSGFLGIAVASIAILFVIPRMPETGGRMSADIYYDWEKRMPLIPLENWKRITLWLYCYCPLFIGQTKISLERALFEFIGNTLIKVRISLIMIRKAIRYSISSATDYLSTKDLKQFGNGDYP